MSKAPDDTPAQNTGLDYRKLLAAMNEAVVVSDPNSVVIYVNPSLCRLMESTAEDIIGRKIDEFLDARNRDLSYDKRAKRLDGKPTEFEITVNRKDGGKILCAVSIAPLLDENGDYAGSIGTMTDITSLKQEQELSRLFKASIEKAPEGIFWMTRDGKFSYVNEQVTEALGYTREEMGQVDLWDIDPAYPRESYAEQWNARRDDGEVDTIQVETSHVRKDGTSIPIEVCAKHIYLDDKELHVAFTRDISSRKKVEHMLKLNQFALDRASISCFLADAQGRILYANNHACQSLGYSLEELRGKTVTDIDPLVGEHAWKNFWQKLSSEKILHFESDQQHKDGSRFPVEVHANFVEFDGQQYAYAFTRDLTERNRAVEEKKQLEEQLIQSQKLESVGRLAGGIAHDFNNMLSVILGYCELLQPDVNGNIFQSEALGEIERAALHSRDVTQQLLAFSRKQIIAPENIDLNLRINDLKRTLLKLIGEDISLNFIPGHKLWEIRFDSSQIDQILINLAINSRDAMPDGGTISIHTVNIQIAESSQRAKQAVVPGQYVRLVFRDNGIGMEKKILDNIFEPFFTTKEVGKGTGLGLSTVYGIVKQNKGYIDVTSKPGQGAKFEILLPAHSENLPPAEVLPGSSPAPAGEGNILLVEDNFQVRAMTAVMLGKMGYQVLVAETPERAVELFRENGDSLCLLLSDVVMPGMSGPELYKALNEIKPGLKALFMSGYAADVLSDHASLDRLVEYIQKPFSKNELGFKLQEMLSCR